MKNFKKLLILSIIPMISNGMDPNFSTKTPLTDLEKQMEERTISILEKEAISIFDKNKISHVESILYKLQSDQKKKEQQNENFLYKDQQNKTFVYKLNKKNPQEKEYFDELFAMKKKSFKISKEEENGIEQSESEVLIKIIEIEQSDQEVLKIIEKIKEFNKEKEKEFYKEKNISLLVQNGILQYLFNRIKIKHKNKMKAHQDKMKAHQEQIEDIKNNPNTNNLIYLFKEKVKVLGNENDLFKEKVKVLGNENKKLKKNMDEIKLASEMAINMYKEKVNSLENEINILKKK